MIATASTGDPLMVVASLANPGGNITGLSGSGANPRNIEDLVRACIVAGLAAYVRVPEAWMELIWDSVYS